MRPVLLVALAAANQFVTGAAWTTFSTVTTFKDIVVGDFNGDGRDDIAGRSAQGQLLVAVSTGTKFNNVVFDTLPVFTPGAKYRDAIGGTIVRQADGIHLNEAGAKIAAEHVVDLIDRDF